MANLVAYIQLNFIPAAGAGTPTAPVQAGTYQAVAPWGQTQACTTWEEAVNQLFRHSRYTGKQGNYWNTGTTNGLSTSISGTATANDIISTDFN